MGVDVLKEHIAGSYKLIGAATAGELHVVEHPCGRDTNHVIGFPLVVNGSCGNGRLQHFQIGEHLQLLGRCTVGYNYRTTATRQINLICDVLVTGREQHGSKS